MQFQCYKNLNHTIFLISKGVKGIWIIGCMKYKSSRHLFETAQIFFLDYVH